MDAEKLQGVNGWPGGDAALGLVAAFSQEAAPLLRGRKDVVRLSSKLYGFSLCGKRVLMAISGAGASLAGHAAQQLSESLRLTGLISIGFAAGLQPEFGPGTLVVAQEVIEQATQNRFPCELALLPWVTGGQGKLLAVNAVISSAAEKQRLAEEWGAAAADMESAGVARAAQAAGLPFAAVKCVTDGSGESIAIDFQHCGSEHEGLAAWKIVREALTSVQGIRDLIRLAGASRRAAENLALALGPS